MTNTNSSPPPPPPPSSPRPPCPASADFLPCDHCVEFLQDYLEDRLPAAEKRRFDAHIALCPDCETFLQNYKTTIALTGALAAPPSGAPAAAAPDPSFSPVPDHVIAAILHARPRA